MSHSSSCIKPHPKTRNAFFYFSTFETRWRDNDRYGHLNNSIYYELFDSAINKLLIEKNILNFESGDRVFLVAASGCNYFSELAYPDIVEVGLAISRLGSSSITYGLGMFKKGADLTAASGFLVHVNVARGDYRPTPILDEERKVLEPLMIKV